MKLFQEQFDAAEQVFIPKGENRTAVLHHLSELGVELPIFSEDRRYLHSHVR